MSKIGDHLKDNLLGISWHDTAWIPILNPTNVLDYFSERSNPFYDRTCNNEIVKMQRLSPEQLTNMTGLEYSLLHVQEPILYVIRKQHRFSATQVTPIADYYIIAGVVYQSPDLGSVVNSRLSAFDEVLSYSRYHPSKGYTWEFKDKEFASKQEKKKEKKEDPSSMFQRQRVDMLLVELARKFPLRVFAPMGQLENPNSNKPATPAGADDRDGNAVIKIEPQQVGTPQPAQDKSEMYNSNSMSNSSNTNGMSQSSQPRMKPPPEKRPRLN